MRIVIVAPHADDEIIGCCHVLMNNIGMCSVYFGSDAERLSAEASSGFFNFIRLDLVGFNRIVNKDFKFFFPDPYFELHPEHRRWGAIGVEYLRKGFDVTFYSTNMNAPYIHELKASRGKLELLNEFYPEKSDLWKYDHKYFLFEGYTKWLINPIPNE